MNNINSLKTYFTTPQDFYGCVNPKFGDDLKNIASCAKPKSSLSSRTFRMPSNPFCSSCNNNNINFLKNEQYIKLNEEGSDKRVLITKDQFISQVKEGSLKLSQNMKSSLSYGNLEKLVENYYTTMNKKVKL